MLIDERCGEDREMALVAAELLRVVAAQSPDSASVAGLRWRMARTLADHCGREEHGAVVDRFHTYIRDWPVSRITREWAEFGRATRTALASIAGPSASQERHLHPHAGRAIARRAA